VVRRAVAGSKPTEAPLSWIPRWTPLEIRRLLPADGRDEDRADRGRRRLRDAHLATLARETRGERHAAKVL